MMPVNHPAAVPPLLAAEYAAHPAPADPTAAWDAFGGREEIRTALKPVQRGICPYCEESLDTWGFQIDHVVPKSRDHSGTFRFTNLVLSCVNADQLPAPYGTSCGHARGNTYDPVLFISPTDAACTNFFSCKQNGELQPAAGLLHAERARADFMIRELNLKCERLNRRRRDWIHMIQKNMAAMGTDRAAMTWYLQDCLSDGKPFLSVVQEYFGWI
jgi:uncharacterized protein (TIGR02646 family)